MAEEDYTTMYRRFFETVVETAQSNDPLPLRVASYSLTEEDLLGQVVDCCVQYLYLINCPASIVTTLAKSAIEEVCEEYKKQPQKSYEPLKIMQTVTKTVVKVCSRYLDNEALSSLPPPASTPLVSALGIKHTRRTMEDRMVFLPHLHTLYNVPTEHETGYYAIFDGHNGADAASYAVSHLHQFLIESPQYHTDVVAAFTEAYAKTDSFFMSKGSHGGSTGLAILHQPTLNRLVVSWLGDSQAMLIKSGKPRMIIEPHTPQRKDEIERIQSYGGFVVEVFGIYRVNGEIAVSRSFGDRKFKPLVSAEPDVQILELDGTEEILVLGCDGLWDYTTPAQVCDTLQFQISHEPERIDLLSRRLVDLAKENGSLDNISVITVLLKPPSEVTIPENNMETQELDPFRVNVPTSCPSKHGQDDDFGPETNVDAIDDSNPFGGDCWTRPDPVQSFPDFTGLKTTPGMRLSNDFCPTGYDNPFASNNPLQDIAEEKFVEDLKPEKEKLNGLDDLLLNGHDKTEKKDTFDDYVSNGIPRVGEIDAFNVEEAVNGFSNDLSAQEKDLFNYTEPPKASSGLPDLVQEQETACSAFDDFKTKDNNPFDSHKEELFKTHEEKDVEEEETNPFDRSTPEPQERLVENDEKVQVDDTSDANKLFQLEEGGQLQLETLKSMMLAEESNLIEDLDTAHSPLTVDNLLNSSDPKADVTAPKENFDGSEVVETAGEGDESEEEWNYYKVEKSQEEQNSMNSPLNPNAAEFVPVSPPTGLVGDRQTPVKAIPDNLLDEVVISSPNWANMDHVEVPALDDFLAGARTCPSDLALDPNVKPFEMPGIVNEEAQKVIDEHDDEPLAVPLPVDQIENIVEAAKEPVLEALAVAEDTTTTEDDMIKATSEEILSVDEIPQIDSPLVAAPSLEPADTETLQAPSTPELTVSGGAPISLEPSADETLKAPVNVISDAEPSNLANFSSEPVMEENKEILHEIQQPAPLLEANPLPTEINLDAPTEQPVELCELDLSTKLPEQLLGLDLSSEQPEELRGLDLAKDMTSSFIDPSTMGDNDIEAETPRSTVAEPASRSPSTPLTAELTSVAPSDAEEVVEKLEVTDVSNAIPEIATVGAIGAAAAVAAVAAKTTTAKPSSPKTGPSKPTVKSSTTASTPKGAATSAKKPATPTSTRSPAPAKVSPTKPPVKTTSTAPASAAAKSKAISATTRPASAAAPKPTATVPSAKPKPTTKPAAPVATKAPVKSTIPPRTTAPPKPRVPTAQTNGDAKTEKKAEPTKKSPTTLTNRVPLSARPASAPARPAVAPPAKPASVATAKTAAPRPAPARPATAKTTSSTTTAAKPKTAPTAVPPAKKPVSAAPKANGVAKPAPSKRVAPSKAADTKTEAKTAAAKSCEPATPASVPISNGVAVSE